VAGNYFASGGESREAAGRVAHTPTPCSSSSSPTLLLSWLLLVHGAGCREPVRILTKPAVVVDSALRPEHFAAALRKIGKAHLRATTAFEAGPDAARMERITTETDIWLDQHGNWRLVEINDRDGGREVVLHDREIAVALRYGKMIRRTAEEPEPGQILAEGVGGPFAAWDLLRDVSTVDDFGEETRAGRKVHVYKVTNAKLPPRPTAIPNGDRRSWRKTLVAGSVEGLVVVDDATGAPLLAELKARYSMRRPTASGDAEPMMGSLSVRTSVEEIGASPEIARAEAEDAPLRSRTVPDEKALLGGLGRLPSPQSSRGTSQGAP
jgi:hypothetical protein